VREGVITFLFLLLNFSTFQSFAAMAVETQFDAANKLYAQNKFTEAATAYEQIITNGAVSPVLYFNLGNAHFKAGQIGHAIAAYRQAERLRPRDPDLRANLRFAQNRVQGPTLKSTATQRWLGTLSLNEWTLLGVAGIWLTLGLLIARQIKPALAPALKNWTWLSVSGTVVLFICLALALPQNSSDRVAIVTATDATVRNSPLDEAPSSFTAHDGAELRVLDHKGDWLQVTDDAQRFGWVKRSFVNWPLRS
jgi:tetratricopeptide (TPR) repeat protein